MQQIDCILGVTDEGFKLKGTGIKHGGEDSDPAARLHLIYFEQADIATSYSCDKSTGSPWFSQIQDSDATALFLANWTRELYVLLNIKLYLHLFCCSTFLWCTYSVQH